MPATPGPYDIFARSVAAGAPSNSTISGTLDVVCAWPVSSQYGAGSRFLYYVLIATCVFLRKAEWLRNACLAAALVVPSISALHAIVLSSYHVTGAVDLDIYGAWQFCSIAVIAAPFTLRLSRTYFYNAGRNIIFLWTMLMIAGLVALCVEFSRVTPTDCSHDEAGVPRLSVAGFPYGQTTCNLTCSEEKGPFSPMRGGAANNIYVIPVPSRLTFNAAMLVAAGVCIPAILSLIFTWEKILEINWKRRREPERLDQQIEGVNITVGEMKGINNRVTLFLSVIEIPLFGGAVLVILIIGEINFFSHQLMYQTEPMASIGQWSPIAGTCIAALGSLYLYLAMDEEDDVFGKRRTPQQGSHHSESDSERPSLSRGRRSSEQRSPYWTSDKTEPFPPLSGEPDELHTIPTITEPEPSSEVICTEHIELVQDEPPQEGSNAGRRRVRNWFERAGNKMSDAAHRGLDTSDYSDRRARKYPMIPGEELRNQDLHRTSTQYTHIRDMQAAASYASSIKSARDAENSSTPPTSPQPGANPDAITSAPRRRSTLEVPPVAYHSPKSPQREWGGSG